MGDMPEIICAGLHQSWYKPEYAQNSKLTKYIRADIHESELTKLRNRIEEQSRALDVAEKALESAFEFNNIPIQYLSLKTSYYKDRDKWHEEFMLIAEVCEQALTTIKQAKGEV